MTPPVTAEVAADLAAACREPLRRARAAAGLPGTARTDGKHRWLRRAAPARPARLADPRQPADAEQLGGAGSPALGNLLEMEDLVDLGIPRGGEGVIPRVSEEARIPVLKHYKGICHVFVERTADPRRARRIVLNSK